MLTALALAAALQGAPALADDRRDLVVTVDGVRDGRGVVRIEVCAADTFLSDRCAVTRTVRAQEGAVVVTISGLPAGDYAIQAYHDRNGDGQVTRNALGIPIEALGFSRSPPLGLHGPSFVKAAFAHGAEPQAVTVRLRRFW